MTAIGKLVQCQEDMEITNLDINFKEGIYYTALLTDNIYIIDRKHKNIELTQELFTKHFKIK